MNMQQEKACAAFFNSGAGKALIEDLRTRDGLKIPKTEPKSLEQAAMRGQRCSGWDAAIAYLEDFASPEVDPGIDTDRPVSFEVSAETETKPRKK